MSVRRKLGLAAAVAAAGAMLAAPANADADFTKIAGTMKACTYEVPQVTVQGQCFEVPVQTSLRPGEEASPQHGRPMSGCGARLCGGCPRAASSRSA